MTVYQLLRENYPTTAVKRNTWVSHWDTAVGSKELSVDQIRAATMDAFAATLLASASFDQLAITITVKGQVNIPLCISTLLTCISDCRGQSMTESSISDLHVIRLRRFPAQ